MTLLLLIAATVVVSFLVTGVVRRFALRADRLDQPNERSSHVVPTPRGGGLGIVVATLGALTILVATNELPCRIYLALAGGGAFVAIVGAWDDRRGLPASIRALVHFIAAGWVLFWLRGADALAASIALTALEWFGLVWMINLYNFMDGIDGIAGGQAMFLGIGAWVLSPGSAPGIAGLIVCAAAAGFLPWNFPRARIFMGDVASGFLGLMFGAVAVLGVSLGTTTYWTWFVLIGAFGVDATVTLIRRVARGQRATQAHRSHAYQHVARRWGSHVRVTASLVVINVLWLLPWAWVAQGQWLPGVVVVAIALAPLAVLVWALDAGLDRA